MEALRVQTQHMSVLLINLLGDHLALSAHVRSFQDAVAADEFYRPFLPVPFVPSFTRTDGPGEDSSSESSCDTDPNSSPSTPSQSFQTCASGGNPQEEGICSPVRPSRPSPIWIPAEQGSVLYSFQSSPADPDGYDAGDETSSPTQRIRMSKLSVGGEEGESDVEVV